MSDYLVIERQNNTDLFLLQRVSVIGLTVANPEAINNVEIAVANHAALSALTGLPDGTIRRPLGYTASGDSVQPRYRLRPKSPSNEVAVAGATVNSAIAGKIWEALYDGGTVTAASFGVIPGVDVADRVEAFYRWMRASRNFRGVISPGSYTLSRPIVFAYLDNTASLQRKLVEGYGAIFNNWILVNDEGLSLAGLTVLNSPSHGFTFLRCQGSTYSDLSVINSATEPFYFAGDGDLQTPINGTLTTFNTNYQVTRGTLLRCMALNCGGLGAFAFFGRATVNRSWFNQMHVDTCSVINCSGAGIYVREAAGATPALLSQFNYTQFSSCSMEVNAAAPGLSVDIEKTTGVTIINPHFANENSSGQSVRMRDCAHYAFFGGRIVGTVDRDAASLTTGVILCNQSASGQGGFLGDIRGADYIQARELEAQTRATLLTQWSDLPAGTVTIVPGGTGIHEATVTLTALPAASRIALSLEFFGVQGTSDTTFNRLCYAKYVLFVSRGATPTNWHADFALAAQEGVTHDSIVNVGNGVFRVRFDSVDNITSFSAGIYRYYRFGEVF